jgi:hypothetical protein
MYCCATGHVAPDVLKGCGAFIFWIKKWTEVNLYISFSWTQSINLVKTLDVTGSTIEID